MIRTVCILQMLLLKGENDNEHEKILALALCVCMVATLAACGEKQSDYKLGMGIAVNMGSSADNNAQVDATVATVVTEANGKIVSCRIDVAQNKMNVTDGEVDTEQAFKTKMPIPKIFCPDIATA